MHRAIVCFLLVAFGLAVTAEDSQEFLKSLVERVRALEEEEENDVKFLSGESSENGFFHKLANLAGKLTGGGRHGEDKESGHMEHHDHEGHSHGHHEHEGHSHRHHEHDGHRHGNSLISRLSKLSRNIFSRR